MKKVLVIGGCGYIGSALTVHLRKSGYTVQTVDLELRGNAGFDDNWRADAADLTKDDLSSFPAVIWAAGMADVSACVSNPNEAMKQNAAIPFSVSMKMGTYQRFINLTTASVLSSNGYTTAYDQSKSTFDKYLASCGKHFVSLRLGTVCGPSPNTRQTLLNSMVKSGLEEGRIFLSNPLSRRDVLDIKDLCKTVEWCISFVSPDETLNLSSFTGRMMDYGQWVAMRLGVPITVSPPSPTYDFQLASYITPSGTLDSVIDDLIQFHKGA